VHTDQEDSSDNQSGRPNSPSSIIFNDVHGFVPVNDRYYAVIVGREPGVYRGAYVTYFYAHLNRTDGGGSSHRVTSNVNGIPHASAARYKTLQLATKAFDEALDAGKVVKVVITIDRILLCREDVYGTIEL